MFEGSFNSLTEISSEIISFGIWRLEQTNSELDPNLAIIILDFFEQEIGTSRFKFKKGFSTFLYLSGEKSNLGVEQQLYN